MQNSGELQMICFSAYSRLAVRAVSYIRDRKNQPIIARSPLLGIQISIIEIKNWKYFYKLRGFAILRPRKRTFSPASKKIDYTVRMG